MGAMSLSGLLRKRRRGFALIELIVVVAIIGIVAALIVPNLFGALRRSKQKRTMTDMHHVGTAWMSWLTDQVAATAAGQQQQDFDWTVFEGLSQAEIANLLVPKYATIVPAVDAWGYAFEYGSTESPFASTPMGIRSSGGDGAFSTTSYKRGSFAQTNYEEDIVWVGGYFVHWPSGLLRGDSSGS